MSDYLERAQWLDGTHREAWQAAIAEANDAAGRALESAVIEEISGGIVGLSQAANEEAQILSFEQLLKR
jgi:hypothetical protein